MGPRGEAGPPGFGEKGDKGRNVFTCLLFYLTHIIFHILVTYMDEKLCLEVFSF